MKQIPNLLTLANAVCGMMAIYFIQNASNTGLAIALIAAAVFDALDGWAARKVGSSSELGKQLDSLADAISFGATAGFLWSSILADFAGFPQPWSMIIGALVTASSVMRLAKFNISTTQSTDFIGMPTPANALFALGLWSWLGNWDHWQWTLSLEGSLRLVFEYGLLALALYSVYWQNARFRVISLKDDGNAKRKWGLYALGAIFLAFVSFFGALSISIVVFLLPIISGIVLIESNSK
jgi:CDP-diacylglycerol--serine O-phosphatidyltransferase